MKHTENFTVTNFQSKILPFNKYKLMIDQKKMLRNGNYANNLMLKKGRGRKKGRKGGEERGRERERDNNVWKEK